MTLLGSLVFFVAYREWLSGFLLMLVAVIPMLSLLLSLPAMISCRVRLRCPAYVTRGTGVQAAYEANCRFPIPELQGKLVIRHCFTGKKQTIRFGSIMPTDHCGGVEILKGRIRMYDYLGLFRFPVARVGAGALLVRPEAVKPDQVPDMTRYISNSSRPKPGGGYAENHELRLYRPGDSLRQIHWKLSAKTGKLILREPMENLRGLALLTMELSGSADVLDRKLGNLLWMSRYLLEKEVPHRICCFTGAGMRTYAVSGEGEMYRALDALLREIPVAEDKDIIYPRAQWRYHIGGDSHGS